MPSSMSRDPLSDLALERKLQVHNEWKDYLLFQCLIPTTLDIVNICPSKCKASSDNLRVYNFPPSVVLYLLYSWAVIATVNMLWALTMGLGYPKSHSGLIQFETTLGVRIIIRSVLQIRKVRCTVAQLEVSGRAGIQTHIWCQSPYAQTWVLLLQLL